MTDVADHRGDGPARRWSWPGPATRGEPRRRHDGDHAAPDAVTVLPVRGLPEFRPGDDLAAALVAAPRPGSPTATSWSSPRRCSPRSRAGWCPPPPDPDARDALRRQLVDAETERVLARRGRTLIVAGKLGIVQAAAGVDGSNVRRDELALLPADPDASAARLRADLRRAARGRRSPSSSPTPWAARWRVGQTDVAIGSAGLAVLHRYAGAVRPAGQRAAGHRGRDGRRAGRGGRPGQGQARRRCRWRWCAALAPVDDGSDRARAGPPARRGPVLARHRRGASRGAAGRRCCCAAAPATSPTTPVDAGRAAPRRRRRR